MNDAPSRRERLGREIAPIAILVAAWALLFWRVLLGGEVIFDGEIHESLYPFHRFLWDELRAGHGFPLWNPYPFFGYPLIGAVQVGIFYPPNFLLGLADRLETALSLSISLHLLLAGLLMYAYARAGLRFRRAGAVGAAAVWALNGHMLGNVAQLHNHATLAWVPLVLLSIERAAAASRGGRGALGLSRKEITWLSAGGIAMGLSLLGGMVQQSYYFCVLAFCYLAVRSRAEWWEPGGKLAAAARLVVRAGLVLGIGAGLFAVQLLPCAELAGESARREMTYANAASYAGGSVSFGDLLGLAVLNDREEDGWGPVRALNTFHVGFFPLGLSLWAGARSLRRGGVDRFFTIAAALALAIAAGGPVFRLLYALHIPGFSLFHDPARVMTIVLLAVAVLCGRALDGIDRARLAGGWFLGPRHTGLAADGRFTSPLFLVLLAASVSAGFLLVWFFAWSVAAGEPLPAGPVSSILAVLLSAGAALLVLGFFAVGPRAGRVTSWALCAGALAPLCFFGARLIPTDPESRVRQWIEAPPDLALVHEEGRSAHPYRLANTDSEIAPTGPFETEFRVPTSTGFASLIPERVLSFTRAAAGVPDPRRLTAYTDFLDFPGMRAPSACRFLVAGPSEAVSRLAPASALVGHLWGFPLYRDDSVLPRAFLVESALVAADARAALETLKSAGFDPRRTVVLERDAGAADIPETQGGHPDSGGSDEPGLVWDPGVEIAEDRPDRIVLRLAPEPARRGRQWLVLSDTHYPGWEASVDGKPRTILRANYAFRCLRVPPAAREVVFTYRPSSFRLGLAITAATALCAGAILAASILPRRALPSLAATGSSRG